MPAIENDQVNLVWDSTIITDTYVPHNRLDVTIVLKEKHHWLQVDAAVPDDGNILTTDAWKIERYQEVALEVRWVHQVEVVLVPLVIGALRTISKNFAK